MNEKQSYKRGDLVSLVDRLPGGKEARRAGWITQYDPEHPERGVQIITVSEVTENPGASMPGVATLASDGKYYDEEEVLGAVETVQMIQPAP